MLMVEYSAELQERCFTFLEKDEAKRLLVAMETCFLYRQEQQYSKKEILLTVFISFRTGQVAVQNKTGFGERMQVVALLDPGAPVGEKGLLGRGLVVRHLLR